MSKSCCFAVVLAVVCLPVILLSLEADAQPRVIMNMVKIAASNGQQNAVEIKTEIKDEIRDVNQLIASGNAETNGTRLEEAVKEIADEIEEVKTVLVSGSGQNNETRFEEALRKIAADIADVKKLIVSSPTAAEPSKQALVSALQCEYLV